MELHKWWFGNMRIWLLPKIWKFRNPLRFLNFGLKRSNYSGPLCFAQKFLSESCVGSNPPGKFWLESEDLITYLKYSRWKQLIPQQVTSGGFEVTSGQLVQLIDCLNSTEWSFRIKWPTLNWLYDNLFNIIRKIYMIYRIVRICRISRTHVKDDDRRRRDKLP